MLTNFIYKHASNLNRLAVTMCNKKMEANDVQSDNWALEENCSQLTQNHSSAKSLKGKFTEVTGT